MNLRTTIGLPIAMLGACVSDDDATPPTCAVDDFSSRSIDPRVWGIYEQPPSAISQRNGELVAVLAERAVAYTSVYSVQDLDFRGTSVAVEVTAMPDAEGAEVLLQWVVNNKYRHFIAADAGRMFFGTQNDAAYETREVPYDPATQQHWRLRHDDRREKVIYETSADRISWVVGHESTVLVPLQDAYVELAAGTYLEVDRPGTATFDNFELSGACAP